MSSQRTGRWRVHINMDTFILCTVKGYTSCRIKCIYNIGGPREGMHPPCLENCYTYLINMESHGQIFVRSLSEPTYLVTLCLSASLSRLYILTLTRFKSSVWRHTRGTRGWWTNWNRHITCSTIQLLFQILSCQLIRINICSLTKHINTSTLYIISQKMTINSDYTTRPS